MTRKNKIVIAIASVLAISALVKTLVAKAYEDGKLEGCTILVSHVVDAELRPVCEYKKGRMVITVTNPLNDEETKSVDIQTGQFVE